MDGHTELHLLTYSFLYGRIVLRVTGKVGRRSTYRATDVATYMVGVHMVSKWHGLSVNILQSLQYLPFSSNISYYFCFVIILSGISVRTLCLTAHCIVLSGSFFLLHFL